MRGRFLKQPRLRHARADAPGIHTPREAPNASTAAPLLQRRSLDACACGGDCPRCRAPTESVGLAAIGPANDALEREAEATADAMRSGVALGDVRVHQDGAGGAATTALNARAFTVGRDITFAPGEFRPDTPSGQHLIAHELTHVAQQERTGTPVVQRQPKTDSPPWLNQIDDILARRVGLIVHIARIMQLNERYSTDQLNDLIALIHASPDATAFTRDEAGVPGIIALQDTRIGQRLDVAAARLRMSRFPEKRLTPRKSDDAKADVFDEAVVRDAYIRFHYNAILPGKDDPQPPDLPNEIRENCIAIVHELAPRLFASTAVTKQIDKSFKKLRDKGETYTMVHTGNALTAIGVADPRVEIRFKDAAGKTTNGDTEPATLAKSAWDTVMTKVGTDYGWHVFGMAIMDGYHSITLFVDNQPEGKTLYWADQWRIDPGDDFFQLPGAISGFRQYEKEGFERFIETMTNSWWKEVHTKDSKCGKAHPKNWDSACRYNATLMLWQLRKVVSK